MGQFSQGIGDGKMRKHRMVITLCIIVNVFAFTMRISQVNIKASAPTFTQSETYQAFLPVAIRQELQGYFVSPNGSDSNPGTFLQPWKTIGKAARTVKSGDTVFIRGGIYNESVRFNISGTALDPIKIMAYPDETPIIEGYNQLPLSYTGLVSVFGDWVQVSGLEVRNSKYTGFGLYGKHDTAYNVFVHHSQKSGINISGDYGVVESSKIWRNSIQNEYGQSSSWSSGLVAGNDTTDGLTEYAIMRKNVIWENWGQGLSTDESNQTIMEDNISYDNFVTNIYISDATHVLCQRNFVYTDPSSYVFPYGSHVGIMMGDERYTPPSADITVINNISFGNLGNFWWWQGVQGGGMKNVLIANNTFVNGMGSKDEGQGGVIISSGTHENVRFINNLVQQDGDLPVIATLNQPGVVYSHNLWSKPPSSAASGPGDVIQDPMLSRTGVPYEPDWFRLTGLSPAIDMAQLLPEIVDDYFGITRGSLPDMGAIEYFP